MLDRVGICHALTIRPFDDAVAGAQLRSIDLPMARGGLDEHFPHLGGRVVQRGAAVENAVAAGGVAFVGRQRGVGGEQIDRAGRHLQTFGGNLQQRGFHPGAQFDLAGVHGDAVGADANPRVEVWVGAQAAGQVGRQHHSAKGVDFGVGQGTPRYRHQREGHEQRAATQEGPAAGVQTVCCAHIRLPLCPATCLIASMMRKWVPQRHRLPAMCSRMVCSSGCGSRSSNACARISMPAMQ